MLRILLAGIAALSLASAVHAADCPLADIEKVLTAPLDGMKPIEKDVSEIQSTEGGLWQIYKDGKAACIRSCATTLAKAAAAKFA